MKISPALGVKSLVCVLAALTNLYLPQPVLTVLAQEFGVNETSASLAISMVILGITLANIPFGALGDRYAIRPLILIGGGQPGPRGPSPVPVHRPGGRAVQKPQLSPDIALST